MVVWPSYLMRPTVSLLTAPGLVLAALGASLFGEASYAPGVASATPGIVAADAGPSFPAASVLQALSRLNGASASAGDPVDVAVGPTLAEQVAARLPPDVTTSTLKVRSGDTFRGMFAPFGIDVDAVIALASPATDLRHLKAGRSFVVSWVDGDAQPAAIAYEIDADRTLLLDRNDDGWTASLDEAVYETTTRVVSFELNRSLWADGLEAGLRDGDIARIAKIFEYELDFNTELRDGARFSLVADVSEADGRRLKLGTIHAIRLDNGGKRSVMVRFAQSGGEAQYFKPSGEGARKPFLRSPLEFGHVTSGFNNRRFHPVLKIARPHNGTDFGAPTGTPVRAVANGRVEFAGNSGGHGRHVKIDHQNGWDTSYSHLSRFVVRDGQTVKQGQVIGYVGSTGLATGPHLHYQMWRNGQYVDPMKVSLPRTSVLSLRDETAFRAACAKWLPKLDAPVPAPSEDNDSVADVE
jgi:murein DD-endopeptidase MepM/ murein hydrolase activator NlpD